MSFLRFAIVFGVLSSSTAAFAGRGAGHQGIGRGMEGGQRHACITQMNLTPEQTKQIAAIHKEFDLQRENIATTRAERIEIRNAQQAKVDAILTPEQRALFAARRGNRMGEAGSK